MRPDIEGSSVELERLIRLFHRIRLIVGFAFGMVVGFSGAVLWARIDIGKVGYWVCGLSAAGSLVFLLDLTLSILAWERRRGAG